MMHFLRGHHEKILFGLAAAALAGSGFWWWRQQRVLGVLRSRPEAVRLAGEAFVPADLRRPGTNAMVWPQAPEQSRGRGWGYEVFTPPVVYYNSAARSFTVTPSLDQGMIGSSFGLELLAVTKEQFRLQLAGYFGAPGDYLAAFTSPLLSETLFGREGRRFETLGLTLKSFEVKKVLVEHDDGRPVYDVAALAVLVDEQTGTEVMLDSRIRKFTATPLAVVQLRSGDRPRELREGDTFAEGGSTYRIERIQLDPPEVVVARSAPGLPQPEINVLHPSAGQRGDVAASAPKTKPFPERTTPRLATAGK